MRSAVLTFVARVMRDAGFIYASSSSRLIPRRRSPHLGYRHAIAGVFETVIRKAWGAGEFRNVNAGIAGTLR